VANRKNRGNPIVWVYDGLRGLVSGIFGERKKSAPESITEAEIAPEETQKEKRDKKKPKYK